MFLVDGVDHRVVGGACDHGDAGRWGWFWTDATLLAMGSSIPARSSAGGLQLVRHIRVGEIAGGLTLQREPKRSKAGFAYRLATSPNALSEVRGLGRSCGSFEGMIRVVPMFMGANF